MVDIQVFILLLFLTIHKYYICSSVLKSKKEREIERGETFIRGETVDMKVLRQEVTCPFQKQKKTVVAGM